MVPSDSCGDALRNMGYQGAYVRPNRHAPGVAGNRLVESFDSHSGDEPPGTVVLLGSFSSEPEPLLLDALVRQFGWSCENAANLNQLREISGTRNLVAVLVDPGALGTPWNEALQSVLETAPSALPILCQRFSEADLWPEYAAAGAFHCLSLPLDVREMRQSLGFVWAKRQRPGNGGRLHRPAPARRRTSRVRRDLTDSAALVARVLV